MSSLEHNHRPGILLVLSQAKSTQFDDDIEAWYNTEHGPARLKLGKDYFLNGFRYMRRHQRSTWLAIYEMKKLSAGASPTYTSLREKRSLREMDVLQHKLRVLSRQFLELVVEDASEPMPSQTLCTIAFEARRESSAFVVGCYRQVVATAYQGLGTTSGFRLFRLVDGTGSNRENVTFIAIHTVNQNRQTDEDHLLRVVDNLRKETLVTCSSCEFFGFHHTLSADDYVHPQDDERELSMENAADRVKL